MEYTFKAALVEDEELARRYLRELLASHPEIVVAAECANGFEAVKAIAETSPDLLFLDAQMPKLDSFEVLELIASSQAPVVIFVTAYDHYAMRAFDAHATVKCILVILLAADHHAAGAYARVDRPTRAIPKSPPLPAQPPLRRDAAAWHRIPRSGRRANPPP